MYRLILALVAFTGIVLAQGSDAKQNADSGAGTNTNPTRLEQHVFIIGGAPPNDKAFQDTKNDFLNLRIEVPVGWNTHMYFWDGNLPGASAADRDGLNDASDKIDTLAMSRKGGKVLLWIAGHGMPRDESAKEKTHSINLPGDMKFSLDHLEDRIRALLASGFQVALVDTACNSGADLALLNVKDLKESNKLCVITSSTSNYVTLGYPTPNENFFSQALIKAIGNPQITNLQQAFLKGLYDDRYNFPQESAFDTPDLGFYEALAAYDPVSYDRPAQLTAPMSQCLACSKTAASVSELMRKFDKTTQLPDVSLNGAAQRDNMKALFADLEKTYYDISKVAYQLSPKVGEIMATGYEEWPKPLLENRYTKLKQDLSDKLAFLMELHGKLEYKYLTGNDSYRDGQDVMRTRELQSACRDFRLR